MPTHLFGVGLAFVLLLLTGLSARPDSAVYPEPSVLLPGDILFTDSGDAIQGGAILKVNPESGNSTVVAVGSPLSLAYDLVPAGNGHVFVSAQGRVVWFHAQTGEQRPVSGFNGKLGYAFGIAIDKDRLFVANGVDIVEVDLRRDRLRIVASGGLLTAPIDVAVGRGGDLYVVDAGQPNRIIRIHPWNGSQSLVTRGGYLYGANSLACVDGEIFVTCVADPSGNFGTGRVVRVSTRTGRQHLLSEGGSLCRPMGIVAVGNSLLVADPYTPNPLNSDSYDGAVLRIDLATGRQEILARGSENFVNPRGIAVVPGTLTLRKAP